MSHEHRQTPFEQSEPRVDASGMPMLTPDQIRERDFSIRDTYKNFVRLLQESPFTEVSSVYAIGETVAAQGTPEGENFQENMTTVERTCYVYGTDKIVYKITQFDSKKRDTSIRVDYINPNTSRIPAEHVDFEYLKFTVTHDRAKAQRHIRFHEHRNNATIQSVPLQTNELDGLLINLLDPKFVSPAEVAELEQRIKPQPKKVAARGLSRVLGRKRK
jgi:hypothetical protein